MPPESASMFEPQLYAVFGSPIGHSRSPDIHRRFAEQTGQDLIYTRQEVKAEEFESACREFFQLGGSGLNITLPLKELAFRLADRSTERARQAAAVNTLKLEDDGTLLGDNTDGVGLVRDLCETLGWQVADRRILLLGAGGAVRGVLGPLLAQKPEQLWIANRTAARAQELAKDFAELGEIRACGLDAIPAMAFDLVINGTSMSLQGQSPPLGQDQLGANTACYDMAYGAEPTAFLRWARENGVSRLADGLGMLVEQAAEAFYLWRGVRPQTAQVIAALRAG